MTAFGLVLSDFQSDTVDVWPEHQPALRLFLQVSTQWRVGMNGFTGLDYNVLFVLMDRLALDGEAFNDLLDDIRAMEAEALKVMRE